MKRLITICVLAAMTSAAYALPSDNFNDNSTDTSMWGLFQESPSVWLNETNGRLEVRSSADIDGAATVYLANGWGLSTANNFSFKADFHDSSISVPGDYEFGTMLGLANPATMYNDNAGIAAGYYYDEYGSETFFSCDKNTDGIQDGEGDKARSMDDGTLYISYDASKDELYLSDTGYWSANAWVTIPGVVKGEWGSAVVIPYLGASYVRNIALGSGDAYVDTFVVDSGTISGGSAVDSNNYIASGRAAMFWGGGSLSGLREAYRIFDKGMHDPKYAGNRELVFLHAATNTAMLVIDNNNLAPTDSFMKLANDFGVKIVGDYFENLRTEVNDNTKTPQGCYQIPTGAPDATDVAQRIRTIIDKINDIIGELDTISDSKSNRFTIFFEPIETGMSDRLYVDYGEVLILKGALLALKSQLEFKQAYDFSVDPNDPKVQNVASSLSCGVDAEVIINDFLSEYPDLLTVLPDGNSVLKQAKQDSIDAINYYFKCIDYIASETNDLHLFYIDPNDRYLVDLSKQRLTTLRDSLQKDTPAIFPVESIKIYQVSSSAGQGRLELVYDITGFHGDDGSLTFSSGSIPTPWNVDRVENTNSGKMLEMELSYESADEWRQGWFEGNLSKDGKKVTNGTLEYWGERYYNYYPWWESIGDSIPVTMQLGSTQTVSGTIDLNPVFGGTTRYPRPVSPRDLLPEFDNYNKAITCTFGYGLNNDATLGGILPDMNQNDWSHAYGLDGCGDAVRFGRIKGKDVPRTVNDSQGTPVTFTLTGGGYGEVKGGAGFDEVDLYLTTTNSMLTISTKAKDGTSVGSIICNGPLKSISAKNIDIHGSITIGSPAIPNPKAAVMIGFDQAIDLSIKSGMPINILSITEWLNTDGMPDELIAPSIGSLTIKGDKNRGLAGDFEAALNIGNGAGANLTEPVIKSLQIAGTLSGESVVHGSVGTATINILKGRLDVEGDAKSLKVNHSLVTMAYPQDAGELVIGGKASITAGKDKINVQKGAELYGSQDANLYQLEDLRRYDEPGAWWDYHATGYAAVLGYKQPFDCDYTANISADYISGHDCTVIETSGCGADLSTGWYSDGNGTHLVAWRTEGFDLTMDVTMIAQQYVQLGQTYKGAGSFNNGTFYTSNGCTSAYGYIDGSVSTTIKLLGHEEVTVPAGTFLAAKVETTMLMKGTMDIHFDDCGDEGDTTGSFNANVKQTWWGVPGIGIVKAETKSLSIKIGAKGAGSFTITGTESDQLSSYGP